MLTHGFLFDIAIILLSTKILGMITKRFHLPQVVGALVAGIVLGPAMLNMLHETDFLQQLSSLGVIVLMFTAGLETDIKELKKTGVASFIIALLGVLVPLVGGFALAMLFNKGSSNQVILQNIFIGIILTATSVSITVETLKELGKLNTKAGNTILGAALIDDILGIIALTLITSFADASVSIFIVILKIVLFFIFAGVIGIILHYLFRRWVKMYEADKRRFVIISFVICLLLSFIAEEFFGVADITGAFIAGLIISGTEKTGYINSRFETLSYILLSPVFFASIGVKVELGKMTTETIIFTLILVVIAVLTKIIGCGLGAKVCKYSNKESLQIGVGMISRGEVALIVASKGLAIGLMVERFLAPIVLVVVVTTIITPVLLKIIFKEKNENKLKTNLEQH